MVTFDTLKASHRLREAGFEEQKANALVNAFAEDIGASLATKDDIALLKGDIDALRKDMASGFELLRQEMTSGDEAIRKEMASGFELLRQEMTSENEAIRKDMANGDEAIRKDMANGDEAIRKDMASGFELLRQEIDGLRKDMALREARQTTRMTLLVAGMAGLILTAIGIATGILATL